VVLRAINYAFSWPLRESLYIPTVKEIKFKSKSWIDAFGSKFAKSSGSALNILAKWIGPASYFATYSFFFTGIIGLWVGTAFLLGRRFERAVAKSEVIGVDEE
jgi:AAA family ATP:ADP antiporter